MIGAALVAVGLVAGGGVWGLVQLADQLGAPGVAAATGSGPCTSSDAVNLQLAFADGHVVVACTRDLPACPIKAGSPFQLENQLRSSSRRYILLIRSNLDVSGDLAAEAADVNPGTFLVKGPEASPPVAGSTPVALIQVTPRDPTEDGYTPGSGTLTLSSGSGVVQGTIDAGISQSTRSDRPQPSGPASPQAIRGRFACRV